MRSLALQRDVEVWKMKIHAEEFTGKRRRFRDVRHPEPLQRFAHLELHRRHAHFFLLREPELFGASFEARFEIRHGIFVAEETRVHEVRVVSPRESPRRTETPTLASSSCAPTDARKRRGAAHRAPREARAAPQHVVDFVRKKFVHRAKRGGFELFGGHASDSAGIARARRTPKAP